MPEKDKVDTVFEDFQDSTNMTLGQLKQWKDDPRSRKASLSREPIEDVIRLKETPRSEWSDEDDGFNEVEEAQEVNSFVARMSEVDDGETVAEPDLSKQDISLMNWGHLDDDVEDDVDKIF
jgi:hypothetical protein